VIKKSFFFLSCIVLIILFCSLSVFAYNFNTTLFGVFQDNTPANSIEGARGLQYDGRGLVIVSATTDDSFTMINVTNPSSLSIFGSVNDASVPGSVDNIWFGTLDDVNKIFYAPGFTDDSFAIYNVSVGVVLLNDSGTVSANPSSLDGVYDVAFVDVGTSRFIVASASVDDTLSVYDVTNPRATPVKVYNRTTAANPCTTDELRKLYNIPGTTLIIGASTTDDTVSIFNISSSGIISCVTNYTDSAPPRSIDGLQDFYFENSTKLLYVPANIDSELTILNLTNTIAFGGAMIPVGNYTSSTNVNRPVSVALATIDDSKFAFIGSTNSSHLGIKIINITDLKNPIYYGVFNTANGTCVFNQTYSLYAKDNWLFAASSVDSCFYSLRLYDDKFKVITNKSDMTFIRVNDSLDLVAGGVSIPGVYESYVKLSGGDENLSSIVMINLSNNIDASSVVSLSSRVLGKSLLHNYKLIGLSASLLIPIPSIAVPGVYICPNATDFDMINESCDNKVEIKLGETVNGMSLSYLEINELSYYVVQNISGTGGGISSWSGSLLSAYSDSSGNGSIDGARNFVIYQNMAIIASNIDDAFTILNVSNKTSPRIINTTTSADGARSLDGAYGIDRVGSNIYICSQTDNSISAWDIATPSSPVFLGNYTDDAWPCSVDGCVAVVAENRSGSVIIYVTSTDDNGLTILNFTNPAAPTCLGQHNSTSGSCTHSATRGAAMDFNRKIVYTAENGNDNIDAINVSNLASPVCLDDYTDASLPFSVDGPNWFTVDQDPSRPYVYVPSTVDHELTIINATVFPMTPLGNYSVNVGEGNCSTQSGFDATLVGTTLYVVVEGTVASGYTGGGISVFNVSNPLSPVCIGWYNQTSGGCILNYTRHVEVDNITGITYLTSLNDDCFYVINGTPPLTFDTTSPVVNAVSPADDNWTNDNTPQVTFNFTDGESSTASCTLFFNSTMYGTNSSTLNNTNTVIEANATVLGGNYVWNVTCTDLSGNIGGSTPRTIHKDATPPGVNAVSPDDANVTSDDTPSFQFYYNDSMSVNASCTLYINTSLSGTNSTTLRNTITTITSNHTLSDGDYSWNVTCTEIAGNRNGTVSRTITILTAPLNTCSCPVPAADWRINLADHCNISSCDNTGFLISFENGTTGDYANITGTVIASSIDFSLAGSGAWLTGTSTGYLKYGAP